MIEVALDAGQNLVIDDILIAQPNNRPALNSKCVLLQTLVGGRHQAICPVSASVRANLQLVDAVVVFNAEPLHDVRWEFVLDFSEVS